MDAFSTVSLVIVAVCGIGVVVCGVKTWRAKGQMLAAAESLRATAHQWDLLGRPDRAAECVASAERWERTARPRKTTPTSTEGSAA